MFLSWLRGTHARAVHNALTLLTLWLISATSEVLLSLWQQHGSPPLLFAVSTHLLAAVSFSSILLFALTDAVQRFRVLLSELRRLGRTLRSPASARSGHSPKKTGLSGPRPVSVPGARRGTSPPPSP